MESKILSLLGFAAKAGKLAFGMDAAVSAVKQGKSKCVVAAKDISAKSFKEISFHCQRNGVTVKRLEDSDMQTLSRAIGRKKCGIVSVNDSSFSSAILREAI